MKEINNENSIGKIISKLRKDKGLTQAQLAEKLNVSDKTISKWEQDSGSPSIEFFPALANLFNVTIDYLMTGKEPEEKIITMSKIELCAKKDDPSVLDDFSYNSAKIKDENGLTLMDYIKKYNSVKVFETLIDDCKNAEAYNAVISPFSIENFIFLVKTNRDVVVLNSWNEYSKQIRILDDFSGSIKNCLGSVQNIMRYPTYTTRKVNTDISEDFKKLFEYLIKNFDKLSNEQKEYYFDLNGSGLILKKNCWYKAYPYFIDLACQLNTGALKDLLRRIDSGNTSFNEEIKKINYNIYGYSRILEKMKRENLYVEVLESSVLTMINLGEYELAERLNNYTKEKVGCDKFEHDKIMKDKKIPEKKKQQLLCLHNGILNIDELLQLNDFKVVKQMLEEYPICLYEKLMNLLTEKKDKDLFKFAVDCNLVQVAQFVLREQYNNLQSEIEKLKELSENNEFYKFEKENYKYIKEVLNKNSRLLRMRNDNSNIEPYDGLYNFEGVMAKVKSKVLYDLSLKFDKIKISKGLDKEYFISELEKGNNEIVIVKLCVKLEAVLKCDYKFVGTFEEMLNKYVSAHLERSCDDGWGYMVDASDTKTINLLNNLRKVRNNIVHAEKNDVNLSTEDLQYCIEYICKLDKEN